MRELLFNCPICHVITSEPVIEFRKDEPMLEPELPTIQGCWSMLWFECKLQRYHFDHWNRTIVCPNCGEAHHYFEERRK